MEEIHRNPPIENKSSAEKEFFYDLYNDLKTTPRHVIFWHLVGYAVQTALAFILPEAWGIIQIVLLVIFMDIVFSSMSLSSNLKPTANLLPQSLFFLLVAIVATLSNAIVLLFRSPIKLLFISFFNFIKRFNNWIDNL